MCGIIGYWPQEPTEQAVEAFGRLMEQSTIRGKHAYGLTTYQQGGLKTAKSFDWKTLPSLDPTLPTIAHTRYCQSGDWKDMNNNQPIDVGFAALAFNGVIHMGTKAEFEAHFGVTCVTENDGEVFLRLLERCQNDEEVFNNAARWLRWLPGSFAGVWLTNRGLLYAGRNERRPLWETTEFGAHWYASTEDIFRRAGFDMNLPREVQPGVTLHRGHL